MARNPVDIFRAALFVAFVNLVATGAAAAPRSIGDCEAIKQADAYNQCLASFGPVAHTGPAAGETPAVSGQQADIPAAADRKISRRHGSRHGHVVRAGRSRHGGISVTRHGGGRVRATFDVRRR